MMTAYINNNSNKKKWRWVMIPAAGVLLGGILALTLIVDFVHGTKPTDMFYCGDWDCTEFISRGKTLLKYSGRTNKHLSFKQNEDIKILSKPVDDEGLDWVGLVQKRVGLVPRQMVREDQTPKRMSTYKYPLNELPLWKKEFVLTSGDGSQSKNEVEQEEEDAETEDTSAETDEVPNSPNLEQDTVQATDEVKKPESVTVLPSDATDHVVPEISEATVTTSETLAKEQQEVIIEPTKSSTLDQVVPATSVVVVEPSEIVDLKDSQDLPDVSPEEIETKPNKVPPQEVDKNKDTLVEDSSNPAQSPEQAESESENTAVDGNNNEDDDEQEDTDIGSEDYTSAGDELAALLGEPVSSNSPTDNPEEVVTTTVTPPVVNSEEMEATIATTAPEEPKEIPPTHTPIPEEPKEIPKPVVESLPNQEFKRPDDESVKHMPNEDHPGTTSEVPDDKQQPLEITPEESNIVMSDSQQPLESQGGETINLVTDKDTEERDIKPVLDSEISTSNPDVETENSFSKDSTQNTSNGEALDSLSTGSTDESPTNVPELAIDPNPIETQSTENSVLPELPAANSEGSTVHSQIEQTTEPSFTQDESSQAADEIFITTHAPYSAEEENTPSAFESYASPTPRPEVVSEPELHPQEEVQIPPASPEINHSHHDKEHNYDQVHEGHHHHSHDRHEQKPDDSSSFILIVKHLSSTLLSFLPEHLQDTIIDVDDAFVLTGIIALTLVSICVPYFLIEGFFAVRPLKKKVVELNKSLWKVTTAYENQQEEFEMYKKKALAYDEDKSRIEQLEYELGLLKTLEGKHKNEVKKLNMELKTNRQLAEDTESLYNGLKVKLREAAEEGDKWKKTAATMKEALKRLSGECQEAQAEAASAVMDLELARQSNETLTMKVEVLEREVGEMKTKLNLEIERRRKVEDDKEELAKSKTELEGEHADLKKICHQYESTVDDLTTQITQQENELAALKETLGEDSPLVDIAEVKAKLMNAEQELASLQSRVEATTLENTSLSRNLKESTSSLSTIQTERDEALNKLQVLEQWFKEKEEELRKAVERYEAEKNIRGRDKDDLVRMIEEKGDENRELLQRLESCKEEFEELKAQHKNEIRALEGKRHEIWLSLCQAERKAQDSRKESEVLRQTLTALTKEKEGDEMNGEVPSYPLLAQELIPPPLDEIPSYFGLGEGFIPPPPLPLDEGRGPHRPAPLGRLSPNYSDLDDLSPIVRGGGGRRRPDDGDYSDRDSSGSDDDDDTPRHRRSPRGGWVDIQHERDLRDRDHRDRGRDERDRRHLRNHPSGHGPLTSSPIPQGFNL